MKSVSRRNVAPNLLIKFGVSGGWDCVLPSPHPLSENRQYPPSSLRSFGQSTGNSDQAPRSMFSVSEKCRERRQEDRMLWPKLGFVYGDANGLGRVQQGVLGQHRCPQSGEMEQQLSPWAQNRNSLQKRHSRFSLNTRPPLETANRLQLFKPPSVPFLRPHPP